MGSKKIAIINTLVNKSNDYSLLEEKYFSANKISLLDPFDTSQTITIDKRLTVSVVIPAGNVKNSIIACLTSIDQSSFNEKYSNRLEVIVVDDGSNDGTWETIKNLKSSLNLTGIKQNHHGQAQALNTGIGVAQGDIIISCDADMVLSYFCIENFVSRHALVRDNLFVGFRSDTADVSTGNRNYSDFLNDERIVFSVPGFPKNMCLASNHFKNLGYMNNLWMPDDDAWLLPDLVFGALFSLSRSIHQKIGGYDERFKGWGCTDGYLAAKAIAAGCFVIPTYSASGLHASHPPRSGNNRYIEYKKNRHLFFDLLKTSTMGEFPDWLKDAKKRIIESFVNKPKSKTRSLPKKYFAEESTYHKIDTLLSIGNHAKALTIISSISPKDPLLLLKQGKALFGLKRYSEVVGLYKEIAPVIPETAIDLAVTLAAEGKFLSANKIFTQFSQSYPNAPILKCWSKELIQKYIQRGEKHFAQKFYNVALRCFEYALILEPKNKTALKYRELSQKV